MSIKIVFTTFLYAVLTLAIAFLWNRFEEQASLTSFLAIVVISLLFFATLLGMAFFSHSKKKDYKEFLQKIDAAVNKLVRRQQFVEQGHLGLIEQKADDEIWVITTKLATEINDKEGLLKDVEKNLESGKRYTYFIPSQENRTNFPDLERNLKKFMQLDEYKKHADKINFIRLPEDTQFLLEEVVIYNPNDEEKPNDDIHGLQGFTLYEDREEKTKTHMKIQGNMLVYITNRLHAHLAKNSLRAAVEQILTNYSDDIDDSVMHFPGNLMSKSKITDIVGYKNFIQQIESRESSRPHVAKIKELLEPHLHIS